MHLLLLYRPSAAAVPVVAGSSATYRSQQSATYRSQTDATYRS